MSSTSNDCGYRDVEVRPASGAPGPCGWSLNAPSRSSRRSPWPASAGTPEQRPRLRLHRVGQRATRRSPQRRPIQCQSQAHRVPGQPQPPGDLTDRHALGPVQPADLRPSPRPWSPSPIVEGVKTRSSHLVSPRPSSTQRSTFFYADQVDAASGDPRVVVPRVPGPRAGRRSGLAPPHRLGLHPLLELTRQSPRVDTAITARSGGPSVRRAGVGE
jgi:hypothetical protein